MGGGYEGGGAGEGELEGVPEGEPPFGAGDPVGPTGGQGAPGQEALFATKPAHV